MANQEKNSNDLTVMSDEELVRLSQSGSHAALEELVHRYLNLIRSRAGAYFIPGAEKDDIIQEGMIGLYKAVMDFDGTKTRYFRSFAAACIRNNIITAVKAAARKKNRPLNSYVPLTNGDDDEAPLDLAAAGGEQNPEAIVIDRESADGIEYAISKALSKLELEVLLEYLSGRTYSEIAQRLGRDVKAVDNAIQRVKKKLEILLDKKA